MYNGSAAARWIEWRAQRIADPLERLKYLRRMGERRPSRPMRPGRVRVLPALLAIPASLVLAPGAGTFDHAPVPLAGMSKPAEPPPPSAVWVVERTGKYETYSNGLRVENRYSAPNRPRSCVAFARDPRLLRKVLCDGPAGIVFHTTESRLVPFEAEHNGELRLIGEALLEYVRTRRAYNFVIDRFGRVYRIVPESDAANHAGHSVWADTRRLYVDLNDEFLGVSFEAQSESGPEQQGLNPAQVHAARLLTEMLRCRYAIAAENCVTHAQVSVNPGNMRIGFHTDWASGFPYAGLNLPDNYGAPPASMWAFGFTCDEGFKRLSGKRLLAGIALAEMKTRGDAAGAGLPFSEHRRGLEKRYRETVAARYRQGSRKGEE